MPCSQGDGKIRAHGESDIGRHAANALRKERGDELAVRLAKIRDMFNLELTTPLIPRRGVFADDCAAYRHTRHRRLRLQFDL